MKRYWKIPTQNARQIMLGLNVPVVFINALMEKNSDFDKNIIQKKIPYFYMGFNNTYSNWANGWNWGTGKGTFMSYNYEYMGNAIALLRKEKMQKINGNNW